MLYTISIIPMETVKGWALSAKYQFTKQNLKFYNHSDKKIYGRWYYNFEQNHQLTQADQSIYSFEQHKVNNVIFPPANEQGGHRVFVLSDNVQSLKLNILAPYEEKNITVSDVFRKDDLTKSIAFDLDWQIDYFNNQLRITLGKTFHIINRTNNDYYVACYKDVDNNDVQITNPIMIPSGTSTLYHMPRENNEWTSAEIFKKRKIMVASTYNDLEPFFVPPGYKKILFQKEFAYTNPRDQNIGSYILALDKDKKPVLTGISIYGNFLDDFSKTKELTPHIEQLRANQYEYNTRYNSTTVRTGQTKSKQEEQFIAQRLTRIRNFLETFLGRKLADDEPTPTIAFVFTGGGYRAMIETLGFLKGAEEIGLYDCALYMTGLSGSTWAITPLIISQKNVADYTKLLQPKITEWKKLFMEFPSDQIQYKRMLATKYSFNQFHGLVGLFGSLLANALFEKFYLSPYDKHTYTYSGLQNNLSPEKYPFPICTALDGAADEEYTATTETLYMANKNRMTWYEFNPYEIGTYQLGGKWVNSEFFGSIFNNGKSIYSMPEYPLSTFMGIWGSAFALTRQETDVAAGGLVKNIYDNASSNPIAKLAIQKTIDFFWSENERIASGLIPNFSYGMEKIGDTDNLDMYRDNLILIDGGHLVMQDGNNTYRHNFASIPVLWRNVDLLIMCDCNRENSRSHLIATEIYAKNNNLNFPSFSRNAMILKNLKEQTVTILQDRDNLNTPVVAYMLGKENNNYNKYRNKVFNPSNETFTQTFNFKYEKDQYESLLGLTEFIMKESSSAIKEAIELTIKRKKETTVQKLETKPVAAQVSEIEGQELMTARTPVSNGAPALPEITAEQKESLAKKIVTEKQESEQRYQDVMNKFDSMKTQLLDSLNELNQMFDKKIRELQGIIR